MGGVRIPGGVVRAGERDVASGDVDVVEHALEHL